MTRFIAAQNGSVLVTRKDAPSVSVDTAVLGRAIALAHLQIDRIAAFDVDIFALLGMRNLSAFVGELYGATVIKASEGLFRKNPHQDGYPDLLLMDEVGRAQMLALSRRLREKGPFSPFPGGGIEIKATCGSLPTPEQCARIGMEKPELGDQRIGLMKSYDWKAHHRETNNLLGLLWDFVGRTPRICAVFYSSELTQADWGKVVTPKGEGSRTTSVSIMSRAGIRKMYEGWLFVLDDPAYVDFIDKANLGNAIRSGSVRGPWIDGVV